MKFSTILPQISIAVIIFSQCVLSCTDAVNPKNLDDCKSLNATYIIGRKSYCCFFQMKSPKQSTSCIPIEDFIFNENKIIKNANISFPGFNTTINGDITCSSNNIEITIAVISFMIMIILY